MKKILCLLLTASMIFTFGACGNGDINEPNLPVDDNQQVEEGTGEPSGEVSGEEPGEETGEPSGEVSDDEQGNTEKTDEKTEETKKPESSKPQASKPSSSKDNTSSNGNTTTEAKKPTSALNLLSTVWKSYKDDEKFPAAGGDYSEENMRENAPGKFGTSDSGALQSTLAVPEDSAELISSAASLTHMMNLNTFTAGSFKIKEKDDVDKFAEAMKTSIENRRWVCGFPDKMVIITVDKYVVSVFGAADLVDTFKSKTLKAYKTAEVYCDQNVEV